MNGKFAVAPCGHTGETVIGNYVKCLQGCEGKATISPKRAKGHANLCGCFECEIRRSVFNVILKDKDGTETATVLWDGAGNKAEFKVLSTGHVCWFVVQDNKGKTIYQNSRKPFLVMKGETPVLIFTFSEGRLEIKFTLPPPQQTVVKFKNVVITGAAPTSVSAPAPTPIP